MGRKRSLSWLVCFAGLRALGDGLLGLFARLIATEIILATIGDFVRSALDLLEDAARLRLEARWNHQLRGARGVWTLRLSLEIDGNPLSLESALRDLTLDPRLRPEH